MPLIVEGRAADELTEEGRRRNVFLGNRDKVLEEFEESVRLGIFLAELRHFLQDRLRVALEHRELEDEGRVEHLIGFLLEGIHPFLLTANDGRTAGDSLLR